MPSNEYQRNKLQRFETYVDIDIQEELEHIKLVSILKELRTSIYKYWMYTKGGKRKEEH